MDRFLNAFVNRSSAARAQLVAEVVQKNSTNNQIGNLVQNVNLNYSPNKNQTLEMSERRRADNIYFVCQQLRAFPDFKF